jgi:hypothetical protein
MEVDMLSLADKSDTAVALAFGFRWGEAEKEVGSVLVAVGN